MPMLVVVGATGARAHQTTLLSKILPIGQNVHRRQVHKPNPIAVIAKIIFFNVQRALKYIEKLFFRVKIKNLQ